MFTESIDPAVAWPVALVLWGGVMYIYVVRPWLVRRKEKNDA